MRHIARAESLEARRLLSVSVEQEGSTLRLTGDREDDAISIVETTHTSVSIDANGDGLTHEPEDIHLSFTDVTNFIVRLRGGNDELRYTIDWLTNAPARTFDVNMGWGDDQFGVRIPSACLLGNTSITMDVLMGVGDDTAGVGVSSLRNHSGMDIRMDMGAGNDTLQSTFFNDIDQSSLSLVATLGEGQDEFRSNFDYEGMDIHNGTLLLDISGGSDDDNLTIFAGNSEMGEYAQLYGGKTISLRGDSGDDVIDVNLPEADFRGSLNLQALGGSGRDTIGLTLAALDRSDPWVDVLLRGGSQRDVLFADVAGCNGDVVLDGGSGLDEGATEGDASFLILNCEA